MGILRSVHRFTFIVAIVAAAGLGSGSASAALLSYEGFSYDDATTIIGKTGGIGWANAWNKSGNANASENATQPGLTYPNMPVTGNKVTLLSQQNNAGSTGNNVFTFRDPSTSFGTDNSTIWLSFLGQRTGSKAGTDGPGGTATYQRIFALAFFDAATENFSIGELSADPADAWGLNPTTAVTNTVHTTVPIDTQSMLLFKIDYGAANADTGSLWVNPDLSLGEAGLGAPHATISDNLTFNRIRISAGGSQNTGATLAASGVMDEIRIGTSFNDMLVVPEPNALVLAVLLLALCGAWHRRAI